MSRSQTIIKYLALALALFIISSIVSGIVIGVKTFSYIFSEEDENRELRDEVINCDFNNIEMHINGIDLEINKSSDFKIQTNSDNIKLTCKKNTLYINDTSKVVNKSYKLIINIPEDKIFDSSAIELGAGKVSIDTLKTSELSLELGAGKVTIDELNVMEEAEIDGGVGEFNINSGKISNLSLELGVGKTVIKSKLLGDNEINAGVGELNLNLVSSDYIINIDKGIGNATIDGKKASNDKNYGSGNNRINIDGGVGNIKIKTNQ